MAVSFYAPHHHVHVRPDDTTVVDTDHHHTFYSRAPPRDICYFTRYMSPTDDPTDAQEAAIKIASAMR